MGKYSPWHLGKLVEKAKDKKFKKETGRDRVKPKPAPITGVTRTDQTRTWANAENQMIKTKANRGQKRTGQWSNPAAHFELRGTAYSVDSHGSMYKPPVTFHTPLHWDSSGPQEGVDYMACSAQTVILAVSPRAMLNYLEKYGSQLGICARTADGADPLSIRVSAGTFQATTDHMESGTYINWIGSAAKALASNTMALGAPTNMGQDIAAVGRTVATLAVDASGGKSKKSALSERAKNEMMAQRLRNGSPESYSLGGCLTAMGIVFSHYGDDVLDEYQTHYTFIELLECNAVRNAITEAYSLLEAEQRLL